MGRLAIPIICVVLFSCGCTGGGSSCPAPPASDLPAGQILAWDVSQGLWGSASLALNGDGKLTYSFDPAPPEAPDESGETRLEPAEVQRVVDTLARSSVCGMCRQRNGIPDEAVPVLRVRAGGLDCRVDAWDGEWREQAPEIEKLIKDLTARTRPAPAPQPEPAAPSPTPVAAVDAGAEPDAGDAVDGGALSAEARHELLLRAEQLLKERFKIGQQQNAAKCLGRTIHSKETCPKGPPPAKVVENRKAWKALLAELGDDPEVPDLKRRFRATTIEGRYKPKYK